MIRVNVEKYFDEATEISERKGLGHPDTLCDMIAENLSLNLSRYYLDNFGFILHHNVDKILLAGGQSFPKFGGGECTEPIKLFIAGRATAEYKGKKVPIDDIIHFSLEDLLEKKFRYLEMRNFEIHNSIRKGSIDLVELFERGIQTGEFLANDSSSGVGYAPLSRLERVVLNTEQYLNSKDGKKIFPEAGEDIKIMGMRLEDKIILTAGIAFVDRHIESIEDYCRKKHNIEKFIVEHNANLSSNIEVRVNTGDDLKNQSIYLTVTGTSAEAGDDGEVGRGNRPNGLISPYRPMTMEALAGKNPVTHVGKLYNWIAMEIAEKIASLEGISQCNCYLVSRIGYPVSQPYYIDLRLKTPDGKLASQRESIIREIIRERLLSLKNFGTEIVKSNRLLII